MPEEEVDIEEEETEGIESVEAEMVEFIEGEFSSEGEIHIPSGKSKTF